MPRGWEVTFEYGWLLLPPFGEQRLRVTIVNDVGREMPFEEPLVRRTALSLFVDSDNVCCCSRRPILLRMLPTCLASVATSSPPTPVRWRQAAPTRCR